jgi:hypothetical protein
MTKDPIKDILRRLERLEKALSGSASPNRVKNASNKDFVGPSGGIRLLHSKGFFKSKKNVGSVKEALEKEGYHYEAAVIQTALNRLSGRDKLLTSSKVSGKKTYVERK